MENLYSGQGIGVGEGDDDDEDEADGNVSKKVFCFFQGTFYSKNERG